MNEQTCPTCRGSGEIVTRDFAPSDANPHGSVETEECYRCGGYGAVTSS